MPVSEPMRRMRSGCCSPAAIGHASVAPPIDLMNSRRRIAFPKVQDANRAEQLCEQSRKLELTEWGPTVIFAARQSNLGDVAYGSKTDIGGRPSDARFTPRSGHHSGHDSCLLCAISDQNALQQRRAIRSPRRLARA